jgi:uncharacterized protein involved in outer membrane biogenesis
MKKIILWLCVIVVILLVGGIFVIGYHIDDIIKAGVETVGPKVTKVDVKLDAVKLSVFSGSGQIKGLVVGNPKEFKAAQSIGVGTASLQIDSKSLLSDKIVVKKIEVLSPDITFELGMSGNNLRKILDNVQETTGGGGTNAAPKPESKPETEKPAKKLQVDDLLIKDAKVRLSAEALGLKSMDVTIPDIHLTNLGTGPEGITPSELISKVIGAIEKETAQVATEKLPNLTKQATDEISKASGLSTNAVQSIGKGITDMFKKKPQQPQQPQQPQPQQPQ